MFSVAKEDLEALNKRKFRIIFFIGSPCSGKTTQCSKLVNEFKYTHLSTGSLIKEQIEKKTKIGEMCEDAYKQGQLVSSEVVVYLLVKTIVTSKAKNFLIDGFPRSMEQTLYFETHIREVGMIINVQASEEVCIARMKSRGLSDGVIEARLNVFKNQTQPVLDYYQKYGIVRNVDSDSEVGKVYEAVKEQMYPAIYCMVGKKYSGKTTIGNLLAKRMGFKIIDFKEFLNSDAIAKRKLDDNFVITSFIAKLREEESSRVLIEDFPLRKEYYNIFTKNCKAFNKIFYLNVDDNNAYERMNKLGNSHPEYIGSSELNKQLFEFDQKKDLIEFFRQKTNLVEVEVNNYVNLVIEDVIKKIAPSVLLFSGKDSSSQFRSELIEYFRSKLGYEIVDANQIFNENIERQTSIVRKGLEVGAEVPVKLIVEGLKPILLKETNDKYILVNFPNTIEELKEFESSICKVQSLVYVSNSKYLPIRDNSVELLMKKENRLFVYRHDSIDEYLINGILGKNRELTVVYGMPLSGKSTLNLHLKASYNYTLINFVDLILELKRIKGNEQDPPQEPESVEFTYPELLEGFRKHINSLPLNQKICLENIFQGPNELVTEVEQVKKLLEAAGRPRVFYNMSCREEVLLDRWKEVKGITDEVQEEQKAEFMETLDKPKQICHFLNEIAYKTIDVDTNYSAFKSKMMFDSTFGKKMIIFKHDYDLDVDDSLYLFSARYQTLVVNVPYLIYKQFYLNREWARRLEDSYCKKRLNIDETKIQSEEHRIYVKYNPIHFEEHLVNELINSFVLENSREIEETGNFIILTGYLNNDLLEDGVLSFNLPLYEVKKLISLGELTAFIQFTQSADLPIYEAEIAEKPYVEEVKPKVRDPLDVDGDMEGGENPEGGNASPEGGAEPEEGEKPKFKPQEFAWTDYNGNPRNYVQTLLRLKKLPIEQSSAIKSNAGPFLFKVVKDHFKKWETEPQYGGVINLTTINI